MSYRVRKQHNTESFQCQIFMGWLTQTAQQGRSVRATETQKCKRKHHATALTPG